MKQRTRRTHRGRPESPPPPAKRHAPTLPPASTHSFIEFELSDPAALEQEWNYTDRAERFFRTAYRLLVRGFFEEAAKVFDRATRYDPSHYRASVGRIEALILMGRNDEAVTAANAALERYGRNSELGSARGHVYLHADDLDNALECADVATQSAPESAYAWLIAGEARLALAKAFWSASECFDRARQSPDGWPYLELRIALALLEWGHIERATGALQKILAADPNLPLGWILMGDAYRVQSNKREFKRCYRKALELVPDLEAVRQALSWKTTLSGRWRSLRHAISQTFSRPEK